MPIYVGRLKPVGASGHLGWKTYASKDVPVPICVEATLTSYHDKNKQMSIINNTLQEINIMRLIYIFISLICPVSILAQTTTTGGVRNTQINSAYVTPVVTRNYSPKADPYTWDASKKSFSINSSYTASSASSNGNGSVITGGGLKFALGQIFGRSRSEVKLEKLAAANGKRNFIISSGNSKISDISSKISDKVKTMAKNYDAGNYFDAMQNNREIGTLKNQIYTISDDIFDKVGSNNAWHRPSDEESKIESFYSLLTYNRVGKDKAVFSEYLEYYTNCLDRANESCREELKKQKIMEPPFSNACGFRECPELIVNFSGLPLEDIFEIELAFTESAALLGYSKFATENLNSIMNYYSGKIQLYPYYLYMASIHFATGQPIIAQQFYSHFKEMYEKDPEQQLYLQLYLQKMAIYCFSKADSVEGRKFIDLQRGSGYKSVTSQIHLVELLNEKNFKNGRENKLITEWMLQELSSLLQNKEYIKMNNGYCLMLGTYTEKLTQHKEYAAALKNTEFIEKTCPDNFYWIGWKTLRCLTGDENRVIADFEKNLYEKSPMQMGKSLTGLQFMTMMNDAGLYTKAIEVFTEMKKQGVKKNVSFVYEELKGEACIAYYGLKDYSKARKMINDMKKITIKYKRYDAKLYAQMGDISKAKEIYESLVIFLEVKFDDEDIRFMDQ